MTKGKIDSEFVAHLVTQHGHSKAYATISVVLPLVLFEVQALGQGALVAVAKESATLRLDDGLKYKIKYDHPSHAIVVIQMQGNANGVLVAQFTNASHRVEVWKALHPKLQSSAAA